MLHLQSSPHGCRAFNLLDFEAEFHSFGDPIKRFVSRKTVLNNIDEISLIQD